MSSTRRESRLLNRLWRLLVAFPGVFSRLFGYGLFFVQFIDFVYNSDLGSQLSRKHTYAQIPPAPHKVCRLSSSIALLWWWCCSFSCWQSQAFNYWRRTNARYAYKGGKTTLHYRCPAMSSVTPASTAIWRASKRQFTWVHSFARAARSNSNPFSYRRYRFTLQKLNTTQSRDIAPALHCVGGKCLYFRCPVTGVPASTNELIRLYIQWCDAAEDSTMFLRLHMRLNFSK